MAAGSTDVAASSARPSRNPGAAQRAAAALIRDPARSNRLVAIAASCDPHTVRRIRRALEQAGEIPRTTQRAQRTALPRRPGRARTAVMQGYRTTREVARAAGVSREMAWRALHDRLQAQADTAAALDTLTVTALAACKQCGTAITFNPAITQRKACSARCGMAIGRELRREQQQTGEQPSHWPPVTGLPPAPDWSRGLCTTVPARKRSWWTSEIRDEREAAQHMCAGCPVRPECETWSMALPASDPGIYGGLTAAERNRRRRAWRLAIAAQVRNRR